MLRGGEWIRRVKINAHTCPVAEQPKCQLCTTGEGGAVWYLEQSEALSLRKEGSAGRRFLGFFVDDTGNPAYPQAGITVGGVQVVLLN